MPRPSRVPPKLVTGAHPFRKPVPPPHAPRLWNAKRRIPTLVGLTKKDLVDLRRSPDKWFRSELKNATAENTRKELLERYARFKASEPKSEISWWQQDQQKVLEYMEFHPQLSKLSEDVRRFIAGNPHLKQYQIRLLIKSPIRFFAKPANVPLEDRKQVYFPDPNDDVVLIRTPKLAPRFATFEVPLHFNKLDLRDYLKSLYNVDVLHVRSFIKMTKDEQERGLSRFGSPRVKRVPNQKSMTVLLAKPFVYPEEITDLSPWEMDQFWKSVIEMRKDQMKEQPNANEMPDKKHRELIKSHAKFLLTNSEDQKWEPSWKILAENAAVMDDSVIAPPPAKPPVNMVIARQQMLKRVPRRRLVADKS